MITQDEIHELQAQIPNVPSLSGWQEGAVLLILLREIVALRAEVAALREGR